MVPPVSPWESVAQLKTLIYPQLPLSQIDLDLEIVLRKKWSFNRYENFFWGNLTALCERVLKIAQNWEIKDISDFVTDRDG